MRCEKFIREYLPSIRNILANKLFISGLHQAEIADKLYLSQGAVSFYCNNERGVNSGKLLENIKISKKIEEIIEVLILKDLSKEALENCYCEICKLIDLNL